MTDGWISVNDYLPPEGVEVLAWTGCGFDVTESVSFFDDSGNLGVALDNEYATHWQYLPEPPKQE